MSMVRWATFFLLSFQLLCLLVAGGLAEANEEQISNVSLNTNAFNPSRGDKVHFGYALARPGKVSIRVYDADGGLVRTVVDVAKQAQGNHEALWDGFDQDDKPVPDEAYTFTIQTATGAVYDPTTFSGGEVGDLTNAQFSPGGTVTYKLPAAARVLVRLGLHDGPMLKTLVDWKPRVAGEVTEYWDGRDESKVMKLREQKHFSALITYVSLPEATVIAYGNTQETYRDYKLGRGKDRPQKPVRERMADSRIQLRPAHLVPPAWARAPRVIMTFPQAVDTTENDVPEVQEAIDVRIDADPSDRDYLLNDQFEVILFVDNVFYAEAERGYLPLNWHWELAQLPPGEHVLTANISSFKGQVGVVSRKVRVVKRQP